MPRTSTKELSVQKVKELVKGESAHNIWIRERQGQQGKNEWWIDIMFENRELSGFFTGKWRIQRDRT